MSRPIPEIPETAGLVLDLDDTLYPERSFHESGFRWIAQRTGLDPQGQEVRAACCALRIPQGRPLDLLSRSTGIPVSTLLAWHRKHPPSIALYPDAAAFLSHTRRLGVPMILLTDGRSVTQRNKLRSLGLEKAFAEVLISEETGVDKLGEAAFRAAELLLAGRSPIVSVGDNPKKDLVHPLALGWTAILMADRGDNVHPQHPGQLIHARTAISQDFMSLRIGTETT